MTTLGAAGGIATLLYGRVTEKPLIQLAQAASGDYLYRDYVNTGTGTTEVDSSAVGVSELLPALKGYATAISTSGFSVGVMGQVDSPMGIGVFGFESATTGMAVGIDGVSSSPNGTGVMGISLATSGVDVGMSPTGVLGGAQAVGGDPALNLGPWPRGVNGEAFAGSGTTCGVHGMTWSRDGYGVEGYATEQQTPGESVSGYAAGVCGHSTSVNSAGVRGIATASSSNIYSEAGGAAHYTAGVEGYAPGGVDGPVQGVYGHSDSALGCGVWGVATATSGEGCGVVGYSESPDGAGVWGRHWATAGWAAGVAGRTDSPDGNAIWGRAWATTGSAKGVYGQSDSPGGRGVYGYASATSGYGAGVFGQTDSPDGVALGGFASSQSGGNAGVWGETQSSDGVGIGADARADGGVAVWGQAASGWPGAIPMVANGTSGQTASLQEWSRTDLGTLAVINSKGRLGIGTDAPVTSVQVIRPASWTNADPLIRLDGDAYNVGAFFYAYGSGNFPFFSGRRSRGSKTSPSPVQSGDLLMRYGGAGYGTNAFPSGNRAMLDFYAAENWTNTAQGTYVTISTTTTGASTPTEKVRVTGDGSILPPSDNTGSIGKVGQRWSLVRAQTITSGDLTFENGYRVTEDTQSGLLLMNQKGERIARFDAQGNIHIKGDIIKDL